MIKIFSFLIGVPVILLLLFFGLNYSGFCFPEMRFLSDYERCERFFDEKEEDKWFRIWLDDDRGSIPLEYYSVKKIPYKSFESFIKKYPKSCDINGKAPYELAPTSFIDRITGFNAVKTITMEINTNYIDKDGVKKSEVFYYEDHTDNCGGIRRYPFFY